MKKNKGSNKFRAGDLIEAVHNEDRFIKKGALCAVISSTTVDAFVQDMSEEVYRGGQWFIDDKNAKLVERLDN